MRLATILLLLMSLSLFASSFLMSACGGGAEELPTLSPSERAALEDDEPVVPTKDVEVVSVEVQVEQTVEAQAGVNATLVAEAVIAVGGTAIPLPSATPSFDRDSRVPLFRRPTLVSVSLQSSTPLPTAAPTLTPTPAPTVTPTPTSTPVPTSTPLPPPVISPVTPGPVQATSSPGARFSGYQNTNHRYLTVYPEGWFLDGEDDLITHYQRSHLASVSVQHYSVPRGWEVDNLLIHHVGRLRDESDDWSHYDELSVEQVEGTDYIDVEYRRRRAPGSCLELVKDRLKLSDFYPDRLSAFSLSFSVCEGSVRIYQSY